MLDDIIEFILELFLYSLPLKVAMVILGIAAFIFGAMLYQTEEAQLGLWCMIGGVVLGIIGLLASLSSRRD